MTRKKTKPNYELLFKSAVTGLQIAYDGYKTARRKELEMTWVGMDGRFVELNGIGDVRVKASKYLHEVERLKAEVEKYRELMEGAEDAGQDE
jgi:hypothetical protein